MAKRIVRLRPHVRRVEPPEVAPPAPSVVNPQHGLAKAKLRVLVCGGRDYTATSTVFRYLNKINRVRGIACIIQGEARGADALAKTWANLMSVPCHGYHADWDTHGKAAGHMRNAVMLQHGKPDLVLAFPGGRGTYNMVMQSIAPKSNPVRVIIVDLEGRHHDLKPDGKPGSAIYPFLASLWKIG